MFSNSENNTKEGEEDEMQAYQSFNSQAYIPNSAAAAVAAAAYYQHHPQNYVLPTQYSLTDSKLSLLLSFTLSLKYII